MEKETFNIRICYKPPQWFKFKSYLLASEIYFSPTYLVARSCHMPEHPSYVPRKEIEYIQFLPNTTPIYFFNGKSN